MSNYRMHIMVCGGSSCVSSNSQEIIRCLNQELKKHRLTEEVLVVASGCFGFCQQGPVVKIYPDNILYIKVSPEDAGEIVAEHVIKGRLIKRLIYMDPVTHSPIPEHRNISFYRQQQRIALRNCGIINPEDIRDYFAAGGYSALGKALYEMKPEEIIDTIKKSGLRGRGGGGFPTGEKWEMCRNARSRKKYVICNADESDPGTFMDRSLLEGDPHSIIEAMVIAGYAIGAEEGYIYIRAEYAMAVNRLRTAIQEALVFGLLGPHVLGSPFHFHLKLYLAGGAFICGEETALIHSIQDGRGEPLVKPPFPSENGLWNCPTLINNVETMANIPAILTHGAEWFSQVGTESSRGTKVFALTGKINNVGLVEVPMGTSLNEIIHNIGGGIKNGRRFKAVQTGGPSGGCIPAELSHVQIDYNTLSDLGAMMGSGGLIVLDEDDCMINIAKYYLKFTLEESCGKCTPCRVGNQRLYEILERITEGQGVKEDLIELKELGEVIHDCALCGLGQTAPNPVLSTLKYFYEEYEAHVIDKKCPAGKCIHLIEFHINPEKCIGCTLCARNCPRNCIDGTRKMIHQIRQEDCVKCGICYTRCPVAAIDRL